MLHVAPAVDFQKRMSNYGYDTYLIAGVPDITERKRTTKAGAWRGGRTQPYLTSPHLI